MIIQMPDNAFGNLGYRIHSHLNQQKRRWIRCLRVSAQASVGHWQCEEGENEFNIHPKTMIHLIYISRFNKGLQSATQQDNTQIDCKVEIRIKIRKIFK